MSRPALQLPVIQNWSCHNCGGCCREHLIEITEEEKKRIDRQGWKAADGIPSDRPLTVPAGGGGHRLSHQADGACVFLNEQGLCRIHAKFGEAAKPLACRVYPYAFHPHGNDVAVSLRFSCPSVVQNEGQRVVDQKKTLQNLASEILAGVSSGRPTEPPAVHGTQKLDWKDFEQFLAAFDSSLTDDSVNLATRLIRILSWLELVEQSRFAAVRGRKLNEFLDVLTKAAIRAQPDSDLPTLEPSRIGRVMFRQMVAQMLRHDTEATIQGGMRERLRLLSTGIRFTMGWGTVPRLPDPVSVTRVFGSHRPSATKIAGEEITGGNTDGTAVAGNVAGVLPAFVALEKPFSGRTPEIDQLMTRYFRVKLQGMHFCGPANFHLSLVDGFRSLALMYPAALWVARIRAASHGRDAILLSDVQAALATLDHNYGYSPVLGTAASISRLRILARMQQISTLCGWYSR